MSKKFLTPAFNSITAALLIHSVPFLLYALPTSLSLRQLIFTTSHTYRPGEQSPWYLLRSANQAVHAQSYYTAITVWGCIISITAVAWRRKTKQILVEDMEGQQWTHKKLLNHCCRFSIASLFKRLIQMDQTIDMQVFHLVCTIKLPMRFQGVVIHEWIR